MGNSYYNHRKYINNQNVLSKYDAVIFLMQFLSKIKISEFAVFFILNIIYFFVSLIKGHNKFEPTSLLKFLNL